MIETHEHTVGSTTWQIRKIRVVDTDPMFSGARYTFSVESESEGFEVEVRFAPIYLHLASRRQRVQLGETALDLVKQLLDSGEQRAGSIQVSSDGIASHGGQVLRALLA